MASGSEATTGLGDDVRDILRRLSIVESQVVQPAAARSLHNSLPKGILARQVLTANSSAYSTGTDSDFVLTDIEATADRIYLVQLKSQFVISNLSNWHIVLTANDGTTTVAVDRFWREPEAGGSSRTVASGVLWEPAADGTYTLRVHQVLASGAGTLTYQASAFTDALQAARRTFWVSDEGVRPA